MSYMDDASGYDVDQLNFIYNSATVRLTEDRFIKAVASKNDCGGGSIAVRAGTFQTIASNQEFLVLNAHPNSAHGPTKCDTERAAVVKGGLTDSQVASYAGPVFFVGDFNARPDKSSARNYDPGVEKVLKDNGFLNARDIPNAVRKRGGNIDHIYYKTSSTGAPSYYEALDCKPVPNGDPKRYNSSTTCASDHVPIKAIFSNLSGSGYGCNSASTLNTGRKEQFESWNITFYDPTIQACCTATINPGELVGETNAEKAYNFLVSNPIKTNNNQPLSQAQAAGVVGNLMRESGGDTYDLKTDASNGTHFGVVQWGGSRYTALKNFASKKGTKWTDLKTQLEFIIYELENKESKVIKDSDFQAVTNNESGARSAAKIWDKWYERSGGHGMDKRQNNAAKAFGDFSSGSSAVQDVEADPNKEANSEEESDETDTTTLSSTDNASAGCSAASGDYVFPLQASKADLRKWGANPGTSEWKSGLYHQNVFEGYYAVDIMAPEGVPVVAFHAGTVLKIGTGSYGELQIQIKDSEGYTYFYTHLSSSRGAQVKEGDAVEAGKLIAYIGNDREGWNAGSHLHIDKSKNPGKGYRGTCTASKNNCPIASEGRFAKIVTELHESYQKLTDTGSTL